MGTKTYSEIRQAAYFKAAVEMYKLVVTIADENIDNPPEGRENVSQANVTWAASLIETTFKKARAIEELGHEETVASVRQERWLSKYRWAAEARTAEGRALNQKIRNQLRASA